MLSQLKDAAKDTLLYSLGNIAAKSLGFVLVPIYIEVFSLRDYGLLSLAEIVMQLLTPLMGVAVYTALSRWYWDKKYNSKQRQVFKTSFVMVFLLSGLVLLLGIILARPLSVLIFDTVEYKKLILLMMLSAFIQTNLNIPLTLLRLKRLPLYYSIVNIAKLAIIFSLTIYLIVYKNHGLEGIYIAQITGNTIILFILLGFLSKELKVRFDFTLVKPMLKYSYPLVISAVAAVILSISDRFSIRYILGFEQTGVYALSYKITSVLRLLFLSSFQLALVPIIYQAANKEGFTRFLKKVNSYSVIVIIYSSLIVGLFSKETIELITSKPEYTANYIFLIVPILNLALVYDLVRYNISFGLNLAKKTQVLSAIIILMSVVNIILNIVLIGLIGSAGAAVSTLLVQILYVFVSYRITNKYYKIEIETLNILKISVLYIFFISSLFFMTHWSEIVQIIVKCLLILIFPFILFVIWEKEDIEKKRISEFFHKYI